MNGRILNIQRFCIHDGPGIRTTVFFKGCNLRCVWCHNPESQQSRPQLMLYPEKCIGCGECRKVCARQLTPDCTGCGECVNVCRHDAREIAGKNISVQEVVTTLLKDREFYITSHGGITLSGGEPLLQPKFALEILTACKARGLHTAIETAACVPMILLEQILPYTDLFLCDLKAVDPVIHKKCTGVDNRIILQNAEWLKKQASDGKTKVLFRMPVVPGYNVCEVDAVSAFAKPCSLELLAYHSIGASKYHSLRQVYELEQVIPPTVEWMEQTAERVGAVYHPSGL